MRFGRARLLIDFGTNQKKYATSY